MNKFPDSQMNINGDNHQTLVDVLVRRAELHPNRTAYTYLVDGELQELNLTYAEVDNKARAIASRLQQVADIGDRALLICHSDLDFLCAFFGCLYAGVVAVPTPTPTHASAIARLENIASDAGAKVALTVSDVYASLEPYIVKMPGLQVLSWLDVHSVAPESSDQWHRIPIDPQSLAFLQYTSGSTSEPKGVMIGHANLISNLTAVQMKKGYSDESIHVNWMPLYHDGGLIAEALQTLFLGTQCVLLSPVDFIRKPFRWLQAISYYRAFTSFGPNFAYDLCVSKVTAEQRAGLDLSTWQVAVNGAEPIHANTIERFSQTFGPCGFRRQAFSPAYGLAEATVSAASGRTDDPPIIRTFKEEALKRNRVIETDFDDPEGRKIVACGTSHVGHKIFIVNPESGSRCSTGEVGEIWISGPSVALGYWGKPDETADTFRAFLADDGSGPFLRSGDLGFLLDGELFVTGRIKDLIIIQGRNIYPQDIELTVMGSHTALQRGGCAAFSIEFLGEERLVIVQEIRAPSVEDLPVEEIFDAIRLAVAKEHGLQVYAIELIPRRSLPKTTSGKVRRLFCRTAFLDGKLESLVGWRATQVLSEAFLLSPEEIRDQLVKLFQEVLGVDKVNPGDDFFELGGDSLGFMELCVRIEQGFKITLPVELPLQSPSVEGITEIIYHQVEVGSQDYGIDELTEEGISHRKIIRKILTAPRKSVFEKLIKLYDAFKNYIAETGVKTLARIVPYEQGSKMLAAFCRPGWVQRIFFRRHVRMVKQVMEAIGSSENEQQVIHRSLTTNFLYEWRLAVLSRAAAEDYERWVSISGADSLLRAVHSGKGVIIPITHSVMSRFVMVVLRRLGIEDLMVVGSWPYWLAIMHQEKYKTRFFLSEDDVAVPRRNVLTAQLLASKRTLERGGVLIIAADGYKFNKGLNFPFFGKDRAFGIGFAENAVDTGAYAIPVRVSMDINGFIQFDFAEPLTTNSGNHEEQVYGLVQGFIEFLKTTWSEDLEDVYVKHLRNFLFLPPV